VTPANSTDWSDRFPDEAWAHVAHRFAHRAEHAARFHSAAGEEPPYAFAWRHRRHGPPFAGGFGRRFGPPFAGGFFGPGFGRGPRMRRGDVRAAILALLSEQPRNGYQLMQEIDLRTQGLWRASAGSMYPALQQLEDEGLIEATEEGGRRQYRLTEAGRRYADGHPEELAAPWASVAGSVDEETRSLFETIASVAAAAAQVGRAGGESQVSRARQILTDARRALYRILAEEGEEGRSGTAE
jgi:DNA-binding PadR family transcriptional regulator